MRSQLKHLTLTTLLFTSVLSAHATNAVPQMFAQESTDEAIQENIKDRLKKVVDEKKDQVKGLSSEGQEKKGFIATVKRVSEETLTVESRRGTVIITLTPEVAIIQDGKAFNVSNIEIDNQVVILGYQKGEDFTPRRVLVNKAPLQPVKKSVVVGNIQKIDKSSLTLTTRTNEQKIYSFNTKTIYEDNHGEPLKLTNFEVDQDVLLITAPEEGTTQAVKDSAGRILRLHSLAISEENNNTPKPTAKPTGKVSATPKVTAKPTTKPTAAPAGE